MKDQLNITCPVYNFTPTHYSDVMVDTMASQITSLTIVYSMVHSSHRSKKTSKLCVTGLCEGNSPVTGEFLAQRASNAENVSIWWRLHELWNFVTCGRARDSPTVWPLCAFFFMILLFYVPFYVKKKKIDNFMCLLEFECSKWLKAHSRAIPAGLVPPMSQNFINVGTKFSTTDLILFDPWSFGHVDLFDKIDAWATMIYVWLFPLQ